MSSMSASTSTDWRAPTIGALEWYPSGKTPKSVPAGAAVAIRHDAGAAFCSEMGA